MKTSAPTNELNIEIITMRKAVLVLRAINHKLRQQIVRLLHQHGKMIVTNIYNKLNLEQSVVSQHLAILRQAGFVATERDGKFIYYSVNYQRLKEVQELAGNIIESKVQAKQVA